MIRTQISFDEDLYRAAQAQAKRMGISLAELCRRAVAASIAPATPTAEPPWMRFTGSMDGGPNESDNRSVDEVVYGPRR